MKRVLILILMLTLTIVGFTLSGPAGAAVSYSAQVESMQDCTNCEGQTENAFCEKECVLPCSGGALNLLAFMMSSDHIILITNDTIHRGIRSAVLRGKTITPDPSPPKMPL